MITQTEDQKIIKIYAMFLKDLFTRILIPFITVLNKTSINRVVLYFALGFPIFATFTYKDEIKLMLFKSKQSVDLNSISDVQTKCFELRNKYGAESLEVYVYQPKGSDKTHKDRIVFSTGENYKPLSSYQVVNLYSRINILSEINKNGYVKIGVESGYDESVILKSFNLSAYYVIPIVGPSKEVIGEVVWIFKNDENINVSDLILESQIFKNFINI